MTTSEDEVTAVLRALFRRYCSIGDPCHMSGAKWSRLVVDIFGPGSENESRLEADITFANVLREELSPPPKSKLEEADLGRRCDRATRSVHPQPNRTPAVRAGVPPVMEQKRWWAQPNRPTPTQSPSLAPLFLPTHVFVAAVRPGSRTSSS